MVYSTFYIYRFCHKQIGNYILNELVYELAMNCLLFIHWNVKLYKIELKISTIYVTMTTQH